MTKILIVAIFGGIGSVFRYVLAASVQRSANTTFPVGTLAVNLIGCAVIGLVGAVVLGSRIIREEYRLAIMVGLLGGFTTFSSFAWESFLLLQSGKYAAALWNLALSNVLGVLAVAFAYWVGVRLFGA